MDGFGPALADALVAILERNAAEISAAFSSAFDAPLSVTGGQPLRCDTEPLPVDCNGPGLAIPFSFGNGAAVALIPESLGILPASSGQPTGAVKVKLAMLAEQLTRLFFPDQLAAKCLGASHVANLAASINRSGLSATATYIPLQLSGDDRRGAIYLLWPVINPSALVAPGETAAPQQAVPQPFEAESAMEPAATLDSLPDFSRSLLRIQVPVTVTLATKKQPVTKIIELLPGSIIQFNKSCEEMLELEVSGHAVAQGECVKVGDKFGLRITSLIMPGERFESIARR